LPDTPSIEKRARHDRVALITGADSGIGRAVALAFAREGADVLISYLNEDEDAQETTRLVTEAGRKAVGVPGDISQEAHCQALVQRAVDEFGRIDLLVNNAAFQRTYQGIAEISSEEWDYTFRTNIYAMFFLAKAALPHMQPGGAIINTTSIQKLSARGFSAGLCHHKRRNHQLHQGIGRRCCRAGHSCQRRRSRPYLEAFNSLYPAAGAGEDIRAVHAAGACGSACRACAGVCAAGLACRKLYHRPGVRRHWRRSFDLSSPVLRQSKKL